MAKRHKEEPDEEEEYEFIPPDFDEENFIHKEMVSFHTTGILFVAGIIAALVSWGLYAVMDGEKTGWLVGMIILAISFASLRPLFRLLSVDISHWARREWLGTAFLMFFTWLAFFIMFVNPPVSDFADPDANLYLSPGAPIADEPFRLDLFLHDNDAIAGHTSKITTADGATITAPALVKVRGDHLQAEVNLTEGDYVWTVVAKDKTGRTSTESIEFSVSPTEPVVTVDENADFPLKVRIPDGYNIWAVYAEVIGGERVYLEEEETLGAWIATDNFKGWSLGDNTFNVVIEEKNRFDVNTLVRGGTVETGPYTMNVENPGDYKGGEPKRANPTIAPIRAVPGIGAAVLAVGLIGLAFVARRQ